MEVYTIKKKKPFKFKKEHKILEGKQRVYMSILIPEKLKRDFKAKVDSEGKTIQEVVLKLMMGYLLR
jgi:hypothetical protein